MHKVFMKIFCVAVILLIFCPIGNEARSGQVPQAQSQSRTAEPENISTIENEWRKFEIKQHREWLGTKSEIERKWKDFVVSDRKTWVAYDKALDTRSRVDFKDGQILVEAIETAGNTPSMAAVTKRIANQIRRIFKAKQAAGQGILDNQVSTATGQKLTAETLERFIANEVLPGVRRDDKPYHAKDGRMRTRYAVGIALVSDHLKIRADRYHALVKANAVKYGVDPALVMAVIHTESYFNPLAISKAGAVGLMQIIPKYGGREAYQYVYGEDWTVGKDYLFSPGINIELGTAYLHLLETRYFNSVADPAKRRDLVICAYNWGPTAVRSKIMARHDINRLDRDGVLNIVRQRAPSETRNYLERVTERIGVYQGYS